MNLNLFSLFTIPVYSLITYKTLDLKYLSVISTGILAIIMLTFTPLPLEPVLTLMTIFSFIMNYKDFKLSDLLTMCAYLQILLLLSTLIFSVNTWDFIDHLAINSLQIFGVLLLTVLTLCFIKYRHLIQNIYSAFTSKEKLFLFVSSALCIIFMTYSSIYLTRFLDLFWLILAYGSYILWQLFYIYFFYIVETKIPMKINQQCIKLAEDEYQKEINDLLNMKQEIARTYHELENINLLKQYHAESIFTIEIKTGHPVLDFILNQKTKQLKEADYHLKLEINFLDYPLNEKETITLFRNLFDNILNHASNDEEVLLKIIEVKKMLLIQCMNKIKDNNKSSTDDWKHGYGLSIINEIIKDHHGHIEIHTDTHYYLKIIIPIIHP